MMQPYRHERLESPDSIRLLDLLPARKWDAPVECRIRQMTIDKARDKYEALSDIFFLEQFRDFIPVCQTWCQSCTEMLKSPEQTAYGNSESLRRAAQRAITLSLFGNEDCSSWWDLMLYPNCSKLSPVEIRDSARRHNPALFESSQQSPSNIIIGYLESEQRNLESPIQLTQWCVNRLANWAFLVTSSGYLGRTYRTCQEGDQLWLLAGSANPVVLRRSRSEYQFVAPAFFDGMMDGELWPDNEEELDFLTLI
ncbi:HET domain-containing protein [Apiospora aurea]|uniref:HET domain-containing protein n=1 Tax=Apiospora aurea TaxID=335848 RepID=A0ABR1QMF9_9PEZI